MESIQSKSFDTADETRTPAKTRVDVVDLGTAKAARLRFEPGWRWSECIKPVAGTQSCQATHVGTILSGRLHIVHDDGLEVDLGPGDGYRITPGHDAWVVGDEPAICFEFESTAAATYGKQGS